jgi:hypothetical protein
MTTREDVVELVRDGKRYREKRGKWERFWVRAITGAILWPLNGWMFMLAVGITHHEWWPALPTIGYWWACVIAGFIRAALVPIQAVKS